MSFRTLICRGDGRGGGVYVLFLFDFTHPLFGCFLLDIDECASHPCAGHATCTDGLMDWECTCNEPYFGSECQHGEYAIPTTILDLKIIYCPVPIVHQNANNTLIKVPLNYLHCNMLQCNIVRILCNNLFRC